MPDKQVATTFSHIKPDDSPWVGGGLRDFFLYRDRGVAAATSGRVLAQLVKAHQAPEKGTGWHHHVAEFHIVLMLKGWARVMAASAAGFAGAGTNQPDRTGVECRREK